MTETNIMVTIKYKCIESNYTAPPVLYRKKYSLQSLTISTNYTLVFLKSDYLELKMPCVVDNLLSQ